MKRMDLKIGVFLGLVVAFFTSCTDKVVYQHAEGQVYGTVYHITYRSPEDLHPALRAAMQQVDTSLSMFNPSSVISRINRNESRETDSLFRKVFYLAQQVHGQSGGMYDITVAPLVNAWGFGYEGKNFPDSACIDSLRDLVGMEKLALKEGQLFKQLPGMQLDASSIAKGLGVDLVAECLENHGVRDYMVEIGGEIRLRGQSAHGRPWRIGIERPEDDASAQSRDLQLILALDTGALATSGNYRNFYIKDGRKYSHTINPKTGYPVQTDLLSASVYTMSSCMKADAYATAFMGIGFEASKAIVEKDPDMEACLIYEEEGVLKVWISEGLKFKIVRQNE